MAESAEASEQEILALGPPSIFKKYDKEFCERFRILKAWESPMPLEDYLSTHARNTQAMLCSGAVKNINANILRHLPSLQLIITASAGMNHIDLDECRRRGISVANASNIFSADVSDLAVGLLIDVLRKITAGNRFVKTGLWPVKGNYPLASKVLYGIFAYVIAKSVDSIEITRAFASMIDTFQLLFGFSQSQLGGKRVGIVGLGSIGLEVAKRLEAFDCKISYHSRKKKPSVSYTFYSDVCELASNSNILIICCALNEQTYHMINKEVLLALGKGGVIINIARGAIIDEKELVQFLQQGKIEGAGMDVFEHEPNVPKELYELDNVVLSPHVAVFSEESFRDLFELIVGNLEAFFLNKPLLSPILLDE